MLHHRDPIGSSNMGGNSKIKSSQVPVQASDEISAVDPGGAARFILQFSTSTSTSPDPLPVPYSLYSFD
ncbi:hypothetical protein PHSY_007296 [Pseudozyma hubeiensis SY62]|uniref:Uncharacterized protein n=1 Tax=Pseudozyma hubeiensis (strain SY62) TaxID=1305764 RepID=R9PE94_PSEHS|nr:hypothetical protein PHSY_007296 [Pseudozyma hubeiensis SY62]GAC99693.1 hypothetical protein PHSY_007296 [Pseudozyma hubeiensis SY62]